MDFCQETRRVTTYTAHNGSSVIDHFLLSRCLVHLGTSLAVIPNTESKHMPVELELELVGKNDVSVKRQTKVKTQKYVWDANYFDSFLFCFVLRKKYLRFLHRPLNLLIMIINTAVEVFNSAVKLAGDCMKRTVTSGNISGKPWFDFDCSEKRREKR